MKDNIIDAFVAELDKPRRMTKGRDSSKNYHKITISVSQADKNAIQEYAKEHNMSVSAIIKKLLFEKGII